MQLYTTIGAKKLILKVKETATSQIEATPHQVIAQIPSSSQAICASLPSVPAMKKNVQRMRHKIIHISSKWWSLVVLNCNILNINKHP